MCVIRSPSRSTRREAGWCVPEADDGDAGEGAAWERDTESAAAGSPAESGAKGRSAGFPELAAGIGC